MASAPPPESEPLYPDISFEPQTENQSNFHLHKTGELQNFLEKERDTRAALYKKYRRAVNLANGLDTAFVTASIGTGLAGMGLLSTIIAAPIVVVLEGIALGCGLAGIAGKFVSRRLSAKTQKHNEIRLLAESKLNTINGHVSKALHDNHISHEEFQLVLDECEKYRQMKTAIQSQAKKAHSAVKIDEETKKS